MRKAVVATAGFTVSRRYADGVVHIEFPLAPTEVLLGRIADRERAAGARSIRWLLSHTSVAVSKPAGMQTALGTPFSGI